MHAGEKAPHHAAGDGHGLEGAGDDGAQHRGHAPQIERHHAQRQHHIEQCHEGHQLFRHAPDALDAAQQHQRQNQRDGHADQPPAQRDRVCGKQAVAAQSRIDGGGDGVDLGGVARAEHGKHAEDGIEHRQPIPAPVQAVLDVVHGAAHVVALRVALPEMHRERDLGKLGAHAQQSAHPHPEHRARPADGDGAGHARDVARAHRGRQRRAHGLEGGHGAILRRLFLEHAPQRGADGRGEFANLQKAGAQAQVQPHAEDAYHGRNAPYEVVDRLIDGRNDVQNGNLSFVL